MRISELVERSGIPRATVKYYLREGLLMPGNVTSATQAEYGEEHLERLALIGALTEVAGLGVKRAKAILDIMDAPTDNLMKSLGHALRELPPYGEPLPEYPRARRVLELLGQSFDPRYVAVAHLERALAGAEAAGVPLSDERLRAYGEATMRMAEYDIANMNATDPAGAVRYAVLGTAIYEPVIVALRRLAHQDASRRALGR